MARLAAVLMAVAAVVGIAIAWWYAPFVSDARATLATAQRVADEIRGLGPEDVDRAMVDRLRRDLGDVRPRLRRLDALLGGDPLVDLARRIGAERPIAEARAVIAAAHDLVDAGDIAVELGDRFVSIRERRASEPRRSLLPGVVELMATSSAKVDEIQRLIDRAGRTLATVPADATPEIRRAADMMALPIERYGPLLEQYRRVDDVLPAILGQGERKRYLVLAQNPAELRPTGGYTGTFGVVSFEDGRLAEHRFADVYSLDLKPGIPYVEPPEGLQNHLLGEASWQLADANWSPDFPTSAQDALRLYTLESGDRRIDGVIGLTTYAIDHILEVTGPVEVAEYDVTVGRGDVTLTALGLTRGISTPTSQRKEFLNALADTVLRRLFALPPSKWERLFRAFEEISERRLMLAWFSDPAARRLIADGPLTGAVRDEAGDYLYVVEANVVPTSKYNLVVDRSSLLEVAIEEDGDVHNRLQLTWDNRAGGPGEPYASLRSYSTNTEGAYGAYVRVLTPADSEFIEAFGESDGPLSGVESVAEEAGRATFANYLFIPPGVAELTYSWRAPGVVAGSDGERRYRLTVQKQPGMRDERLTVEVSIPAGARLTSIPDGARVTDDVVTVTTTLTRDHQIEIRFRVP